MLERWAVDGEIAIEEQVVKLVRLMQECGKLIDEALDCEKKFKFTEMGGAATTGNRRKKPSS